MKTIVHMEENCPSPYLFNNKYQGKTTLLFSAASTVENLRLIKLTEVWSHLKPSPMWFTVKFTIKEWC